MFGGNPGSSARSPHGANIRRLDDFWCAKLRRLSSEEILRKCQFLIRSQKFREMVKGNPIESLGFLRKEVILEEKLTLSVFFLKIENYNLYARCFYF